MEQDPIYVDYAKKRLCSIQQFDGQLVDLNEKRDLPRVPFGALIERGWIKAGDELFDKKIDIQQRSARTVLLLLLIRNPVPFILLGHSYRAQQAAMAGLLVC